MLDLLLSGSDTKFSELEKRLRNIMLRQVLPFTYDQFLRRTEDADSLYNMALLKLHEAIKDYRYDQSLTREYNERRFVAMLIKYIKNAMIDAQYVAKAVKRSPVGGLFSFDKPVGDDAQEDDIEVFEPPDKSPPVDDVLAADEISEAIYMSLGTEERQVFVLLREGYTAEQIAGRLGMLISRVRHIIYEKIQKRARRFLGCSSSAT